jgi:hypothetical protein
MGPETTCIGPVLSSRHAPVLILAMPLRPWETAPHATKKPFGGERLVIMARGVEHHFDDAFDMRSAGLSAPISMPRRRAIEDRTCSASSFSPSISLLLSTSAVRVSQHSLLAEVEAEGFHMADQPALPVADVGERFGKPLAAPVEPGPVWKLVDVYSPHLRMRL